MYQSNIFNWTGLLEHVLGGKLKGFSLLQMLCEKDLLKSFIFKGVLLQLCFSILNIALGFKNTFRHFNMNNNFYYSKTVYNYLILLKS